MPPRGVAWEKTCCPNRENHPTPFTYVLYPIKGARKGARAAISLRALIEEVERLYKGYLRPPVYTTRPPVGPGQAQFVMADKRRRVRRLVRPQSNFLQLIKTSSSSKGAVYKLLWVHLSLIPPIYFFWQNHNKTYFIQRQFRCVGFRSIGPPSQKLWPNLIFGPISPL